MIRVLVCLFDKRAELFHSPVVVNKLGVVYRQIQDEIARGGADNPLAAHPEDFQLFEVASFDDETGEVVPHLSLVAECSSLGGA